MEHRRRRGRSPRRPAPRSRRAVAALTSVLTIALSAACAQGASPAAVEDAVAGERSTTTADPGPVSGPVERLPPVDRTAALRGLVGDGTATATGLAVELVQRLAVFLGTEGAATLSAGGLRDVTPPGAPAGSSMAAVVEVRYRDRRVDDTTPGYDLIVEMARAPAGTWSIARIAEVRVCSRGTATVEGRPVCR